MIFGGDLAVSIPSSVVQGWLAELPGRRVTLGIDIQAVDLPPALCLGLPAGQASGVMVAGISLERQAQYRDLYSGDILLQVAGTTVKENADLLNTLAASQEGERLPVTLLRGGEIVEIEVGTLLRHWASSE